MSKLALETKTKEQEMFKAYLEENAGELLIEKINNGVKIQKDGKTLLNKKTLKGFMKFAAEEAKKQLQKGEFCVKIEDDVVFGWLIHYFEEDSIEETLYNEDGSEYKKPVPVKKNTPKPEIKIEAKPPEKKVGEVISMFEGLEDIFMTDKDNNGSGNKEKEEAVKIEPVEDDIIEEEPVEEEPINPLANLKSNLLTFPSGDCFYLEYEKQIMYAGPATNVGIIRKYDFPYDDDYSLDENIQRFYDYIIEVEPDFAIERKEEFIPPVEEKPKPSLYERYMEIQNRYPDHVIAVRLGDFYEIFGDNAKLIGNELNMTITSRELGNGRFAMIGFPYHAAESYFNKITLNHSLVIRENGNEMVRDKIEPVKVEGITIDKKRGEVVDEVMPYSIEHVAILAEMFGMENLEGC